MKKDLNVLIGKSVDTKKDIILDFSENAQLAIAGSAGSGKSNFILSVISSLTKRFKPEELQLILSDPKQVEFSHFSNSPYLTRPVISLTEEALEATEYLVNEMENRYDAFVKEQVMNIAQYNKKVKKKLPFIFFIADEISNFMVDNTNKANKKIEKNLIRLAQMSRATGIYMIISTSCPSRKAFPVMLLVYMITKLAFQLPTKRDSLTFLDRPGAEKLLGKGDGLFFGLEDKNPVRVQTPLFIK